MSRQPEESAGDRRSLPRFLTGRRYREAAHRSPEPSCPPALTAAIEAAWFCNRSEDQDGPRIAIHCDALGGGFIYEAVDVERRIRKFFPECDEKAVSSAARHMQNRVQIYYTTNITQPIQQRQSWLSGWREY